MSKARKKRLRTSKEIRRWVQLLLPYLFATAVIVSCCIRPEILPVSLAGSILLFFQQWKQP